VLRLSRELQKFRPLAITGGMDQPTRSAAFDSFERDQSRRVMILSLRAGGTGLNLTAASRVIHFDRWWNSAVEIQAEDRVHRIGQTRPVQVFAYLCADSVEGRIAKILDEKRALFADLIDAVPTSSLGRLDLDTLLHAAAPAF
jgi:SNF2 family DNA or RNA helicase